MSFHSVQVSHFNFANLNFTGKLCVKLLRVPSHVGGLFTCRHKYDINAGGVTGRVTRDSVTPAPRDVVTFPLSKQDSLQSVLWGREYISGHQSWCEIFLAGVSDKYFPRRDYPVIHY